MGTHYQGTDEQRQALDVYIKLSRAAESVSARINQPLNDLGLTISQFGVLEAIYHLGPLHQNELASKILKSSGNITHVVDNLERRDLVERRRDTADRRYISVYLTGEGEQLIADFFPRHVAKVVEEFNILTVEEQRLLATLSKKIGLGIVPEGG